MGLDNGFIVRNINIKDIPPWVKFDNLGMVEFAYMRKCYGIRDNLCRLYDMRGNDDHVVKPEEFDDTIEIFAQFCDKERFENATIWRWNEYCRYLFDKIIALKWLFNYIKEGHEEVEVLFYDSY